ncbi:membrane protein DedA with SNARE-associated domain [Scopulibacillus daqui]|uniref:Membrane protein DedA with SNARE-associated domain n=1 Tax=Scopulibacillus daqui TaxID=1469162 RepID=A0ABS2PWQ2_9BACL|nr:VTT domain-containing protein [Scopulibacillus daqui]MBM7644140.1 membrane protein DedA with SNARE-associated domain [Scopulibacillus daqui]
MPFITAWIEHYGYIVLFLSPMLELLALPLPGEFAMGYAGVLAYQGKLNWMLCIALACLGSCTGITLSYLIGYKLAPFFNKYGHRIHMGPEKLEKMSRWFIHFGNKFLVIACFIPGIRHFTGYFSGITRISFRSYALYAYIGAFLWTSSFISLGKLLGPQWQQFHHSIKKYFLIGSLIIIMILALFYMLRFYKIQIKELIMSFLGKGVKRFRSLRRLRFLIAGTMILLIGFICLIGSLTENYLNNEFKQFDTIAITLVSLMFNEHWEPVMHQFLLLTSVKVLSILIIFTLLWILIKGKERMIEVSFLFIIVIGGEIYETCIRRLFHYLHPVHQNLTHKILYPFPSEQTLTGFVLYGLAAFMLVRHAKRAWLHTFALTAIVIVLILIGLSRVYFKIQYPSDVAAGYAFGGVWLSLNVLVMELFRFSRRFHQLRG